MQSERSRECHFHANSYWDFRKCVLLPVYPSQTNRSIERGVLSDCLLRITVANDNYSLAATASTTYKWWMSIGAEGLEKRSRNSSATTFR